MINFGEVPAGAVLPIYFNSYDANGASLTLTGLAITDIEIYKGIGITQRSSDAGYALIDTDGIDVDGVTGFHGFSVDLGDNTDAGFFAAGSFYTVLVSAVTVNAQTVSFIAATFRIMEAEATAGRKMATAAAIAANAVSAAATAADFLAEVNAEVVDALATDTYAEPAQGAPAATTSLAAKINYLYKAFRNRKTQTSTQFNLFNDDAVTIDHKSTVSDDGTTASRGELASGP